MSRTGLPSAPKKRPTLRHRPAIWECMLGTVYAMNDAGETRYFDYDYEAALEHAGFSPERDPRWYRISRYARWDRLHLHVRWSNGESVTSDPSPGKLVLWITKED